MVNLSVYADSTISSKRIEMIKDTLKDIPDPILNVGSTQGILHTELKKSQDNIYGIDIDVKIQETNVFKMDAQQMTFPSDQFNAIVVGEVLEHLQVPGEFIKHCGRVLKPNGILVITTPNKNSWWNKITKSYHLEGHISLQTPNSLKKLLHNNNFEIKKFTFIPFDKYTSGTARGYVHFYSFRKCMHKIVPEQMKEDMFVVAENKK